MSTKAKAKKLPAKPAIQKKAGNKKGKSNTTNSEKSEKTKQESARFVSAVASCVQAEWIGDFDAINNRGFHDKCGQALSTYILETVHQIQTTECTNGAHNSFPSEKFIL